MAGCASPRDVDQPLGSAVGLRVNGMYEDGDSFRRHVDLERYAINPTLGAQLGPATRLDVGFEYLRDRRTADRGVPSFAGEPVDGFDRTFFGDPDKSFSRAKVNIASLGGEHRFSDALTLRNRTLLGDYDKFYQNIYPNAAVTDRDGTGPQPLSVRLAAYNDTTKRRNLLSQTDLIWNARLGDCRPDAAARLRARPAERPQPAAQRRVRRLGNQPDILRRAAERSNGRRAGDQLPRQRRQQRHQGGHRGRLRPGPGSTDRLA